MLGKLLIAFIAALVVPWIVSKISAGRNEGRESGEFKVVEYGPLYTALMAVGFAFFATLAGLAWEHPGKTDPAVLPLVIAIFLGFATLSLVGLALARRSVVFWNERELEGADMAARRHRIAWEELARIEYVGAATSLRLWSRDGRRLWVSPLMQGFQEFHGELTRQAGRLNLTMPSIPPDVLGLPT